MSTVFQKGLDELVKQNLNLKDSANLVLILVSTSYSPDAEAHQFIADLNSHELDCDGYTKGFGSNDRKTPSGRIWVRNDGATPSRIEFSFNNVTWADLGGGTSANNDTIGGVVVAEERTDDTDSPIIAFDDLEDDRQTNGSDVTYSPDDNGVIQLISNPV